MKPGLDRVRHYSQEQRDLCIKEENSTLKTPRAAKTSKPVRALQSSRRRKQKQEVDSNVVVLTLIVLISVTLCLLASMR